MKTNAKKRMLISSVAMLLVAMIALGTATFAWFTQDTSARTKNLSVETSKASSLKISKDTGDWLTEVDYEFANKLLIPASSADSDNWFTASADLESDYAASAAEPIILNTDGKNTTYLFKDQLNIRNEGDAKVTDVKINFSLPTNDANCDYLRVALVPTTAQGTKKANVYGMNEDLTPKTFVNYIYDNGSDENSYTMVDNKKVIARTYNAITEVGTGADNKPTVNYSGDITPIAPTNGTITIDVPDLDGKVVNEDKTIKYDEVFYNLYVWFEGQDSQCYNANAGVVTPDIKFTVTGTTAKSTAK